ncbi:retinol dehydrogenase 12-like [Anthonomus grandis grandis]|uniref:retinol dehydrogenase 12-like n=1 Tax=Anthonomus grandis grandis TaxID=2921223 RepID=UPI002164F416|nr:retinol dehydrogenase 12-like [Anthonomus grandis grandis]
MFIEHFLEDFDRFSSSWWPYVIALFISVISAIRVYVGGTQYQNPQRIDGKVVIITGGSSGIGFETAKNLAQRGAKVILAVRSKEKGLEASEAIKRAHKEAQVTVKLLDISEVSSIKTFAEEIKKEHETIDVLINNAGIIHRPFKETLMVNYLGPFLLTHLLLDQLNRADNGRIINVSAMAHYHAKLQLDHFNRDESIDEKAAFALTKLALTIFSRYLATLLKDTKITCNSMSPGLVRGTNHLKNLPLQKSPWSRMSVWPWVWLFLKTPRQGCQTAVYLAVEPDLMNVSGYYFSDCEIKEPSEQTKDARLASELYQKSCEILEIDCKKILATALEPKDTNHTNDF